MEFKVLQVAHSAGVEPATLDSCQVLYPAELRVRISSLGVFRQLDKARVKKRAKI